MSSSVFDQTNSAVPMRPPHGSWRSQARLPRAIEGYLKFGSIRSISFVNEPADAPMTVVGWLFVSATKGIRLLVLNEAPMRVKSSPVFENWFEIHT
jgi:hypothetical protein